MRFDSQWVVLCRVAWYAVCLARYCLSELDVIVEKGVLLESMIWGRSRKDIDASTFGILDFVEDLMAKLQEKG